MTARRHRSTSRTVTMGAWMVTVALPWGLCLEVAEAGTRKDRRAEVEDPQLAKALKTFSSKYGGRKAEVAYEEILSRISEAIPSLASGGSEEDPIFLSMRVLAGQLEVPGQDGSQGKRSRKTRGKKGPSGPRIFPLPRELYYQFGYREMVALNEKNRAFVERLKDREAPSVSDTPVAVRLDALLHGALPEYELALAEIQRQLDVVESRDAYAQFLEEWRNYGPYGDESFYEALDRTAGTPEEVFFYDAMLGDFVGRFAKEEGKRWNLGRRHDRNQQAFLAYRQYRGLIEAVGFSLILSPDQPLPERLSRYDYPSVGEGLLSFRHQLDLLVLVDDRDLQKLVARIQSFIESHVPADSLWEKYDPLTGFHQMFLTEIYPLVEREVLSANELWEAFRAERVELAGRIRAAAREAVLR